MRLGIVSHFPPPPGGIPGQARALARGLAREGVRVREIPANLHGTALTRWLDSIRVVRTLVRTPVMLLRLCVALPSVDVLHILSGSGVSFFAFAAPAILIGRASGTRVVFHYHSGAAESFLRKCRWVAPAIIAFAHRVIVPSPFLCPVLARYGIEADILPNVCDLDVFRFTVRRPCRPHYVVSRHLEPIYNVECALRAFARVRRVRSDARMDVLGDGSEAARLRSLATSLGLDDSVAFHGYVAHSDVPALFSRASVMVNSSNVDNSPVAILEAFASGLPVVTTAAGGIRHMVQHGQTGLLVAPGDVEGLAAAMIRVVDEPGLAERLASAGRDVAGEHAWPAVYARLRILYSARGASRGSVAVGTEVSK